MKNLALVLAVIFLFSCNTNKDTKQRNQSGTTEDLKQNALLYNNVEIKQEINFYPELNKDWKQTLVNSELLSKIVNGAIEGKPVYDVDGKDVLNQEEIEFALGQTIDTIMFEDAETGEFEMKVNKSPYNLNEIKDLYFDENWFMDKDLTKFEKKIKKYFVVREYINNDIAETTDTGNVKLSKALTFCIVSNNDTSGFKPIAKNVITEFYFDQEYRSRIQGLNISNLQKIILDNVLSGKANIYSFNDLNEKIILNDAKEIIGASTDTIEIENAETGEITTQLIKNEPDPESIIGLIFIENWYFNDNNLMIKKEVTALAPIWQNIRITESGEVLESRMIPFVIKF